MTELCFFIIIFFVDGMRRSQSRRTQADHLMHGRGLTIFAWSSLASQEGFSNHPSCATTEHVAPTGVAMRSQHSCGALPGQGATWLGTKRSGTCESEDQRPATSPPKTTRRHLTFSPDNSGKFGPCASSHRRALPRPWWLSLPWRSRLS